MLRWKLALCMLALQNVFGLNVRHVLEEELDGDIKHRNMSHYGLKQMDLEDFANVEYADFSNNEITDLQWTRIATAPSLKTLDLSGNPDLFLPEVGPSTDLPLSILNMSNCNVNTIMKDALKGLANLEVLDLRENPILYQKSPVFEHLQAPPKRLIVSQISKSDLSYVCQKVDMLVEIVDDDMTFDCKDVRRDQRAAIASRPDRESMTKDYVVEGLLLADTHMEMMADQPVEGSGDGEEIPLPKVEEIDDKQQRDGAINSEEGTQNGSLEEAVHDKMSSSAGSEEDGAAADISGDPFTEQEESATIPSVGHDHVNVSEEAENMEHHKEENDGNSDVEKPIVSVKHPEGKASIVRKLSSDIEVHREDSQDAVPIGETKPAPKADTGKKVILVLVIGAVAMGSVFGIMKVYKDRKSRAAYTAAIEGAQEMNVINECKPLMGAGGGAPAANGQSKTPAVEESCAMVVVENPVPQNGDAMTAKEILADASHAGLPDIDDPSRLSTVLVSNQNLAEAK